MDMKDEIKALFPDAINGKTHQQLIDEDTVRDREVGNNFYDGTKFMWIVQPSTFQALKSFEVRDDDVFLITYPRSGTHWTMEMLQYIMNDGKEDLDRTFMSVGLEFTLAPSPSVLDSATPGYKIYEQMKSPRCIMTHCAERLLPPQVFKKQSKVVYVSRNPKDVFTSTYLMWTSAEKAPIPTNMDEMLFLYSCGRGLCGSWYDHVLSYWKHRKDPNVLFLKYEDLQKDPRGSICKLAEHVGKDLSDDVIDTITQCVSFGAMLKEYQKLDETLGEEGKIMMQFNHANFLRKGKVGDWKNNFTVAQSALFDKIYALEMEGSGLDFDFDLE